MTRSSTARLALFFTSVLACAAALAQVPAPHPPLRILIVSDEVNPHGLPPEDLTQPGDLSLALGGLPGLHLDTGPEALHEIATDDLEQATARLTLARSDPAAYDVLIYFAHRIPSGADGTTRQETFVAAVDGFLAQGGGVISFHHGIYRTAGKQSMQALLGAEATGTVVWNTQDGQNVIATAPWHFVSRYGLVFDDLVEFQDPALGIPLAEYPFFNNTPDERYPSFELLPGSGDIEILFASDYDTQGHLLGYLHTRPEWTGVVLVYQPGEYQPHALEPGNNLQILLNAIVFVARFADGELIFGDGFESGNVDLWTDFSSLPEPFPVGKTAP